ncbi:hypothetical protein GLAREA_03657 [Glarea lozoyensis ATCC 20868]|uniref:Uncharacterized protein n=1 Tax=Glarea lozoyensis (strain ATCC 20868 / MF5171) TaxID=1116229 RepID=S3CYM0_GLAL2|nr:uncharacterized protein GLAREA_03657 [Glarea lozoyensis ATCC 20868]EPE30690.1 hypothetical protein GLAREA_03657 [Glarea lozoyensis ATCC 20868]
MAKAKKSAEKVVSDQLTIDVNAYIRTRDSLEQAGRQPCASRRPPARSQPSDEAARARQCRRSGRQERAQEEDA